MRKIKIIAMVLAVCFLLSGCSVAKDFSNVINSGKIIKEVENSAYFGFSNGEILKEEKEEYVSAAFFDDYVSQYGHLRSDIYYNALSPEHQQVYLAIEYAFENSLKNILVDSALVSSVDELIMIAEYLSLDSPLVEQNLRFECGTFTSSIPVEITDFYKGQASFDGYYISVNNFTADMLNKKLLAVKAVEDVIKSFPENLSDIEKAEHLYKILAKNVTYEVYEDDDGKTSVFPYLYDALITGKTQCDGYANALSLLFRMAGIEAAEKMFSGETDGEVGHTWTAFKIDGKWYNADASSSDFIPKKECSMGGGLSFAFSDELRVYDEDYEDVIPVCSESFYMTPDSVIQDLSDSSLRVAVTNGYDKRTPDWAFVLVKNCTDAQLQQQIQSCANSTLTTVYWSTLNLANGYTAVLVYGKGLL